MNPKTLVPTIVVPLVAMVAFSPSSLGQESRDKSTPPRYRVVDVGTLGGTFSAAHGINDRGWVSGSATLSGDQEAHAFLRRDGNPIDLGTLGGPNSDVGFTPFSETGTVVGDAETTTPDPYGTDFCFHGTQLTCLPVIFQNGAIRSLPTLGGSNGVANQMNRRGQIAGVAENNSLGPPCFAPGNVLEFKPVVYKQRRIHELPTFPGDPDGVALSINDGGQIIGFSFNCDDFHALLWQNGIATDLGNLGGTSSNNASAINNRGEVVGVSGLPDNATAHAFLWRKGRMTDLRTIPGDADFASVAVGINDREQVVGQSCDAADDFCRAFLWQNGSMVDLNTLIPSDAPWFLFEADTINSRGQIAGVGFRFDTGEVHGFLAIPCRGPDELEGCQESAQGTARNRGAVLTLPRNVHNVIRNRIARRFQSFRPASKQTF